MWFDAVVPIMEKTWSTVLYEREHGFEHRKPVKRMKSEETADKTDKTKNGSGLNKCMIIVNKDTGSVDVHSNVESNDIHININDDIKIRTESIDETRQKIK